MAATLPVTGNGSITQNSTTPANGLYKLANRATTGAGFALTVEGSNGSGTNQNGGDILLQPGAPTGTGIRGAIIQNGGTAADGLYKLANRTTSGVGHTLTLEGSNGSGTNQNGGNIILRPGAPTGTGKSGELWIGNESVGTRSGPLFQKMFNVKAFGATGGSIQSFNASITNGSNVLTVTSGISFASSDVGKIVNVPGAGPGGTTSLVSRINSWTSATVVNLEANASATVTGAACQVSSDDSDAIQAAINAAADTGLGGTVYFPEGAWYLVSRTLIIPQLTTAGAATGPVRIQGVGARNTKIALCPPRFSGTVSKSAGGSSLTFDGGSGLSNFNQIMVGDGVTVAGETRIVRVITSATVLQIHGTWVNPSMNQSLLIRRTVFRVSDVILYTGNGKFTAGGNTVSEINSVLPVSGSSIGNLIKANADDVNAWTEILSETNWPSGSPISLGLLPNPPYSGYKGGTYQVSPVPFSIKQAGGQASFAFKDFGIGFHYFLNGATEHNEAHTGIDLGNLGNTLLEGVAISGTWVDLLFDIGIVAQRHGNFMRNMNVIFCRLGIDVYVAGGNGDSNQQRIENCGINFCKVGVHIRGYQNIVYGCFFHGVGAVMQGLGWNDIAIVIEPVADYAGGNNGWANSIIGNYFERWLNHVKVLEKGNSILNNFHSGTGDDNTGLAQYNFGAGTGGYLPAILEASTTKIGNTFNTPGVYPNFGTYANFNNANIPGDLGLAGKVKITDKVAIGAPINDSFALLVQGALTIGTAQWGMAVAPTVSSAATGDSGAGYFGCNTAAAAASYTSGKIRGIAIAAPILGANSSITNNFGIEIGSEGAGFNCVSTSNHGLLINDIAGGTTNNYAIYTRTGKVRFGDSVIFSRQTFSDTDVSCASTTTVLAQTGSLTGPRIVTLPLASTYKAGMLIIVDESKSATSSNKIQVARSGSDTLNGVTTNKDAIIANCGMAFLYCDGVSKWTINQFGTIP